MERISSGDASPTDGDADKATISTQMEGSPSPGDAAAVRAEIPKSHRFRYCAAWGKQLSDDAPKLVRLSNMNHKLVRSNDELVGKGFFNTTEGEQKLPPPPKTQRFEVSSMPVPMDSPRFEVTDVTVANIDTLSAALALGDSTALNFANAMTPGGGYRIGARAQEEDLCRLLPQLIHSLEAVKYPILTNECLLTQDLQAVRRVGSYELCPSRGSVHILTAAMPCGDAGRPGSDRWNTSVRLRMRAVLNAAKQSGFPNLVLGAWGCGAFGNPPGLVATLFQEQLSSPEFRGAFQRIVFAVVDPGGDGNLTPFERQISSMNELDA